MHENPLRTHSVRVLMYYVVSRMCSVVDLCELLAVCTCVGTEETSVDVAEENLEEALKEDDVVSAL